MIVHPTTGFHVASVHSMDELVAMTLYPREFDQDMVWICLGPPLACCRTHGNEVFRFERYKNLPIILSNVGSVDAVLLVNLTKSQLLTRKSARQIMLQFG